MIGQNEKQSLKLKTDEIYRNYKTMLSCCLKCINNTKSKNLEVSKIENEKIMLLSRCRVWQQKSKSSSKLLSELGRRAPFSEIPILGNILF